MPKSDGEPLVRVTLECGHIRRIVGEVKKQPYYCFACDAHKEIKEKLQDPRAYHTPKVRLVPDRNRHKR